MSRIFVFGSNASGRHGKGAALHARKHHGAETGVWRGPTGSAYAIPTKGQYPQLAVLPPEIIAAHAADFCAYAAQNPQLEFQLTAVGCGLAGYSPADIAPMFAAAPANVFVPPEWREELSHLPPERFWSYT